MLDYINKRIAELESDQLKALEIGNTDLAIQFGFAICELIDVKNEFIKMN